jgi:hypothetical protein
VQNSRFCIHKLNRMRIVGTIPHPLMKITVFAMNMKYSVKLEMGLMEQTFKIRESDYISGLEDISRLLDDQFIDDCLEHFTAMHKSMEAAFNRLPPKNHLV